MLNSAQYGPKRTTEKFEVMTGLVIHYETLEETDAAHGYYSKEIQLQSIEVMEEHHQFSEFPQSFELWAYSQICEHEGV